MEATVARIGRVPSKVIKEVWNPQTCPLAALPWLAQALGVSPWNPQWSEAQQRAAVASSIQVHRVKGTVGALKRALQAIGYECEIDEATGEAFTFRVLIDASTYGLTDESVYDDATAIALEAKPARSYLAGVDGLLQSDGEPCLTGATIGGADTYVLPDLTVAGVDPDGTIYAGGAQGLSLGITLAPAFQTSTPAQTGGIFAGGAIGLSLAITL
jgi:phage tail P2-like protein